jgi:hypothetical protein
MHIRFKERNAPTAPPREDWPAHHKDTSNTPEASSAHHTPGPNAPRLNLPIDAYPLIKICLDQLEEKTKKSVAHYAGPLGASTGCDTIGELLELAYLDLKSGRYSNSLIDALEAYLAKALKYDPPRRLVMMIGTSFEDEAHRFEELREHE